MADTWVQFLTVLISLGISQVEDFFCFISILLCTDPFFYHDYLHFDVFKVKVDTFEKLKMADPRWRMVPDPSLTINDVIMTSLLVLKVINVSTNFLILSDT